MIKVVNQDGGADGQVQFCDLVGQGALVRNSSSSDKEPEFSAAGGFTRYWDECSKTPFLHSPSMGQVITYDDPDSLGMKAAFAKRVGMLGTNMFDIHGDTDQWDLTDSIRRALGRE
jgi:chitinase